MAAFECADFVFSVFQDTTVHFRSPALSVYSLEGDGLHIAGNQMASFGEKADFVTQSVFLRSLFLTCGNSLSGKGIFTQACLLF